MSDLETAASRLVPAKWWLSSLTVQGALISAASAALPALATLVGIDGETLRQIGEQTVSVVQAVGGLAGAVIAVVGRSRATMPIERRHLTVRV